MKRFLAMRALALILFLIERLDDTSVMVVGELVKAEQMYRKQRRSA